MSAEATPPYADAGGAGTARHLPPPRLIEPAGRGRLPQDRLERVESWGMNGSAVSYVYRPSTADGVREAFDAARRVGRKVGLRGAGRSYGDASLSAENICLDLTRMRRILEWDPQGGRIVVEPGVTLRQLWQHGIGDGWWPPVVSGTMFVSMGGAAAMNIHGKNNWKMGPFGDHVEEFDLLLPGGEVRTCSRLQNTELFFAALGGFGMLGCFLRITLRLKRVDSGLLRVEAFPLRNLADAVQRFEARMDRADYLVGWIDCFARGRDLGRGVAHQANYLDPGEDSEPAQTLRVERQELPDTLFNLVPKTIMWRFMRPFSNDIGMRLINQARYRASALPFGHKTFYQSHAGFAFLLDYVPNWKFVYKPGGLIQYQSFLPVESAERCFADQLTLCHQHGLVPYLGVLKRHRTDDFLMTHAVDGYSLALDFPFSTGNRSRLFKLTSHLNARVLEAGGRFYFAKDSTLDAETARRFLGADRIDRFRALKAACDPENLLQTELSRRLFGDFGL